MVYFEFNTNCWIQDLVTFGELHDADSGRNCILHVKPTEGRANIAVAITGYDEQVLKEVGVRALPLPLDKRSLTRSLTLHIRPNINIYPEQVKFYSELWANLYQPDN